MLVGSPHHAQISELLPSNGCDKNQNQQFANKSKLIHTVNLLVLALFIQLAIFSLSKKKLPHKHTQKHARRKIHLFTRINEFIFLVSVFNTFCLCVLNKVMLFPDFTIVMQKFHRIFADQIDKNIRLMNIHRKYSAHSVFSFRFDTTFTKMQNNERAKINYFNRKRSRKK